jgi:hypothetical protein
MANLGKMSECPALRIRNTADSYRNIGILSEVPTSAKDIRRIPIEQKLGFSYKFTTFKLHVKRKNFLDICLPAQTVMFPSTYIFF